MAYFKHKNTGKYLSFSNTGTSFNNANMILSDCPMCERQGILEPAQYNDNAIGTSYLISIKKDTTKCLTYDGDENNVISIGDCKNPNSEFEILQRTENPLPYMNYIDLLLLFDNNRNVNLSDVKSLRETFFTNKSHLYDKKVVYVEHFFKMTNPAFYKHDGTEMKSNGSPQDDVFSKNIILEGELFLVIKEYLKDNDKPKNTIYQLTYVEKKNVNGLQFTSNNLLKGVIVFKKTQERFMNNTYRSKKYRPNKSTIAIKYIQRSKRKNFNRAIMGILSETSNNKKSFIGSSIDVNVYEHGAIVQERSRVTTFRGVPYNNIKNSEFVYQYSNKKQHVNMSSAMNPVKKIVFSNDVVQTKNKNRGAIDSLFQIMPTKGSSSLVDPEPLKNSVIGDELEKLKEKINGPEKDKKLLENVIKIIDKDILKGKLKKNVNAKHHNIDTVAALKDIRSMFKKSVNIYKPMKRLQNELKNRIINLPIIDKIKHSQQNKEFPDDIYKGYNKKIASQSLNNVLDEIVNYSIFLQKSINNVENSNTNKSNEYKSVFNLFKYDKINPNTDVIKYLIRVYNYFENNKTVISKYANSFYNYLETEPKNKLYDNSFMTLVTTKVSGEEIKQIEKLITEAKEYTDNEPSRSSSGENSSSLLFIDIDFGVIYRHTQTLLLEYHKVLIKQREYVIKHNNLIDIRIILEDMQSFNVSNTPVSALEQYKEKLNKLKNKYPAIKNTKLLSLSSYIDYALEKMNKEDNESISRFFYNCYRLVLGLDCTNETMGDSCPNVDGMIKKIQIMDTYYDYELLLTKYETNIISYFISSCASMAEAASIKLQESGIDFNAISNNTNITATTNVEGFSEGMDGGEFDYFPSTPKPLNYAGNSDLLNVAYAYASGNKAYKSLQDYISNEYEDASPSNYTCGDENINIDINYKQSNNVNDYRDNIADFNVTPSEECNFRRIAKIRYDENRKIVVMELYDKSNSKLTLIETIDLQGEIEHYSYCVKFSDLNKDGEFMTQLETVSNTDNTKSSMTYLKKITNSKNEKLTKYDALYSEDTRLRLVLSDSTGVNVQYIPPISFIINDDKDKEIGYYAANNKHASIYENEIKLGEHVANSVYIDTMGKSHLVQEKYKSKVNPSYEDYENYCLDTNFTDDNESSTIGIFNDDDASKMYNITKRNLKNVYPSGINGCVGGDYTGTMKLSKYPFDPKYGPCATDADKISTMKISDYSGMNARFAPENDFVDDSVCGLKQMLTSDESKASETVVEDFRSNDGGGGHVGEFQAVRDDFQKSFEVMIAAFNELSENELNILKQTDKDITKMEKIKKEYIDLHKTATKNEKLNNALIAQSNDAKNILDNTEYSMAIVGIGAVGALLILFNYMKK